jgi:hypothetical protein
MKFLFSDSFFIVLLVQLFATSRFTCIRPQLPTEEKAFLQLNIQNTKATFFGTCYIVLDKYKIFLSETEILVFV